MDECLHTSLVGVAHDLGYAADHVNFLGLRSVADWVLMPRIIAGGYVFVTNDRQDFLHLYGKRRLHQGLVILIPSVGPKEQGQLFRAVLEYVRKKDLTGTVLEVQQKANAIEIKEYLWP